jgi:hypothetical protein
MSRHSRHQSSRPIRFPYIVIRIIPAVYQVKPLPQNLIREALVELGWKEFYANQGRFQIAVVFGPNDCRYLRADGTATSSHQPPAGGGRLAATSKSLRS